MNSVTYSIPNISCGHCVHTIQAEVSAVAGVKVVKADVASKTVDILFDEPATEKQIIELLAEINYPVAG